MSEKLVSLFTAALGGKLGNEVICFIISLFPILELRGGLLAASPAFLNVPMMKALPWCIVGNLLPIPFVLLLIEKILQLMERWELTRGFAMWLKKRAEKNKAQIERYGFWGLVLFVGIPLPGTGAWTGSLVAALLHMPFRKSMLACIIGVLMAAVIMCFISYGILGIFA
ncbi:MAG: small multi-drug export protein [Lachnospiraceae bacterium]|nr:small multi-drug export protein [Lachnospiraceae bacterium]